MKIHIWDLLKMGTTKIVVDIKDSLKKRMAYKIKDDIYNLSKELNIKPARLYEYFIWEKSPIPLNILFNISNKINISKEEIERNIILYKQLHTPCKNSIKNPKLPIEINPYFTSIIANLFFDGSVPKDGKGTYYSQKSKDMMEDFIKKVNYVFGDVFYSLKLDHRGILKCRIPRLIGEICRHVYSVPSFGTFDARIPQLVFNLEEDHKIAFILTGIIDEGSIAYDGSIIFGVSNENMIYDFDNLCKEIGLNTAGVKKRQDSNHFYLYIKSREKLYQIIMDFKKEYPFISLNKKENRLKKYLEIKNQRYLSKNSMNKSKENILNEMKNKKCSINYLAEILSLDPRKLRRYTNILIKEGKIKRHRYGKEFIYSLG